MNRSRQQNEIHNGYGSADSTHALRAKGGTNRSKSRCQCRRSARILVAQASCVQVARLPSLAANTLLPLLKQQRRKIHQIRRHTGQLWLPSVSRKSQRTPFFFSTSTNCRLFSIKRSSLPHAIQVTSLALGARTRNVTVRSAWTSGEFGGGVNAALERTR